MIKKALLRFVRAIVETVIQQINNGIQQVISEVLNPMNNIVGEVTGGVWTGDGANTFVEEVQSIMVPLLNQIQESGNVTNTSIYTSMDIIEAADEQVTKIVGNWADTVSAIY